jgi:serine/threonine protein kinase
MVTTWIALTCPQCGSPLPRVALWRSVKCAACGSLITRTEAVVTRDSFRQAFNRARQGSAGLDAVLCGGTRYHLMQTLGVGEISHVYLARRIDSLPLLVTLKLSSSSTAGELYAREAQVAQELQHLDSDGTGPYYSRLLPEVVAQGAVTGSHGQQALVLRHPTGYWGSLASLNERFTSGVDPRHAVWIWRRMLGVLNFIHHHGWCHGDIRPEHALLHPQDHGVRLIDWSAARKDARETDQVADLCRSARTVQVILCGANGSAALPAQVPTGLAQLVTNASQDQDFCRSQGAEGLDRLLQAEAKAAFGPPSFVPLVI